MISLLHGEVPTMSSRPLPVLLLGAPYKPMWLSHLVWQLVLRRLLDLSDSCFFDWGLVFIVLLNLSLAGTTFAALSRASNVITQAATTIKPEM